MSAENGPIHPDSRTAGGHRRNFKRGLVGAPLIQDSATFTLSGAMGWDLASITDVSVNYGTDLNPVSVPEPSMLLLLGLGILGVAVLFRRLK